jgi:hypothetical protein
VSPESREYVPQARRKARSIRHAEGNSLRLVSIWVWILPEDEYLCSAEREARKGEDVLGARANDIRNSRERDLRLRVCYFDVAEDAPRVIDEPSVREQG